MKSPTNVVLVPLYKKGERTVFLYHGGKLDGTATDFPPGNVQFLHFVNDR